MADTLSTPDVDHGADRWLTRYYCVRAAFNVAWVAAAFLTPPRPADPGHPVPDLSALGRRGQCG